MPNHLDKTGNAYTRHLWAYLDNWTTAVDHKINMRQTNTNSLVMSKFGIV